MSEPTRQTIKRLFATSGNICAFPDCGLQLIDRDKVIGEICHIKGRKPGAPRFDASQTDAQRHEFENLVLLCPTHHVTIDQDEQTYSVEKLLEVKAQALKRHSGKPFEISDEATLQFINHLTFHITPFEGGDNAKSELVRLQDKIRERTEFLRVLQGQALSPDAYTGIISFINDVKQDLIQLKRQANAIRPGTYTEPEIQPSANFHNAPQESFFTGREEYVAKVLKALSHDERTWVVSIDGLGGIGKTSLARQVSQLCRKEGLFDEIIWTTAQQRVLSPTESLDLSPYLVELDDLLDEICRAFDFTTPVEFPCEEKMQAVQGLLKQRQCLLIIDNLETLTDNKAIASFLRLTPPPTKTIVTSRQLVQVGEGERFIRLPPLTWEEGVELIQYEEQTKDLKLAEGQARELFDLCDGIPLALTWSFGRMIFSSPEVVLRDLRERRNVEDLTAFCFQSSFDAMQARNDDAAKLFLSLAIFPFPMPREVLREITNIEPRSFESIIADLNMLSLVTSKDGRLETLPLVRHYAKYKLGRELELEARTRQLLAAHISSTRNDATITVFTPSNDLVELPRGATPVDFAYQIHTSIGDRYESARINGLPVSPTSRLQNGDLVAIKASSKSLGPTLEMARTDRARRSIKSRSQKGYRFTQSVRRGNTLSRKGLLGESIREYDLAISLEQGRSWAHNRRGHALRLLGDLTSATREHEAALLLVSEDPFACCGLGSVNYQRGWLDEAADSYRRAIAAKPDYVNALSGLGRTLCRQREYTQAEQVLRDALKASGQARTDTSWLHLYLSISQLSRGESGFIGANQALTKSLRQFSKRVRHLDQDQSNWGSHGYYLYAIALLLANSERYKQILNEAVRFCSARGLRDEIIADLETINPDSWDDWAAYSARQTSKIPLAVRPERMIAQLEEMS